MNKSKGRVVICIEDYDVDTQELKYDHVEIHEKSPLRGLIRKYIPVAGDRIYIYPDANIPRFKLKRFCETYKVSIAKAKETANVFFMDPEKADTLLQYYNIDRNGYLMNKDYFTNYLKKSTVVNDKRYTQLLHDLDASPETVVYLHSFYDLKDKGINKYRLDIVDADDIEEGSPLVNCEVIEKLYYIYTEEQKANLAELEGKTVYHPDAILTLLNEGSVLDKEMYEGVLNLFKSTDPNDHKIAMEAMANCDYLKSAVYLLMAFYHHQDEICNSTTKHHVNFKSFLKFFNLHACGSIDIDGIINRLKDKRLLDSSNLAIVMTEAKKVITEAVSATVDSFKIIDIEPIEEIKKEVEETDAEILAAQAVVIPTVVPVVEPTPVAEPIVETVLPPEEMGGLSHL